MENLSNFINFDIAQTQAKKQLTEVKPIESVTQKPVAKPEPEPIPKKPSEAAKTETEAPRPETLKTETKPKASAKTTKKPAATKSKKGRSESVYIRGFPKTLLALAKTEFPNATNNTDALSAYVAVKADERPTGLSDSVKELIDGWGGDGSIQNIDARLSNLERQMSVLVAILQELELGIAYQTFDYLGYRKEDAPNDIRNVNFLEAGVPELITRMREQTKQLRTQENIKRGKPIR